MAHDSRHEDDGHSDDPKDEVAQMFQTVGNQVENLIIAGNGGDNGDEGPKVVDEIESLCMNCGENVSRKIIARVQASLIQAYAQGSDSAPVDEDPILP